MSSKRFQPPPPPSPKVDLSLAADVACDVCGNFTFSEVLLIKHVSEVQSPNGQAGYAPIPVFACNACGFVNEVFLPPFMRKKSETPKVPDNAPSGSTAPLIEIVK